MNNIIMHCAHNTHPYTTSDVYYGQPLNPQRFFVQAGGK